MEKADVNNKAFVKEAYEKIKEQQTEEEKLAVENKRKETYKKFKDLKDLLNENISIQKFLKEVMNKLEFNTKEAIRPNYIYYIFCVFTIICISVASWYYNQLILNIRFFYLYLAVIFILVNCIALYLTTFIRQRKMYMKYTDKCKNNEVNNEKIINLIDIMLDNYIYIFDIIPDSFFKYFTREYHKGNMEVYMDFLCKNNKLLLKKCKNKKLKAYKKVYSKNIGFFLDVEEMENSYFQPKIGGQLYDTIEECVRKFLSYK